jgi:bacterial/archaeal transporter family-2 protein
MVTAVLGAIFSGITIVMARMLGARLAQQCGASYSSLMNYITGLTGSLIAFLVMGAAAKTAFPAPAGSVTIYLGGALGLVSVYILNNITHRLPATQMTLLIFVGQLFSGILLDYFATHKYSMGTLAGGLLVLAGLAVNIWGDRKSRE